MFTEVRERLERAALEFFARQAADLRPGVKVEIPAGDGVLCIEVKAGPACKLTPCEMDIVRAVRAGGGRKMTTKEIVRAIEAGGPGFEHGGELWGHSTINNGLASLVARGILRNNRDRRGYFLPAGETAAPPAALPTDKPALRIASTV